MIATLAIQKLQRKKTTALNRVRQGFAISLVILFELVPRGQAYFTTACMFCFG
jgi:hypothetical protein